MVFGMFSVHVEGCKNHMKRVAGTCVPSGKGFFQFMVDSMCPFRVARTWGKILAGTFWGRGWTCAPWGRASGGKVDGTRAARCRNLNS